MLNIEPHLMSLRTAAVHRDLQREFFASSVANTAWNKWKIANKLISCSRFNILRESTKGITQNRNREYD